MRHMTARQVNPSPRAQKFHSLAPTPASAKKRGGKRGTAVVRTRGFDTSTYEGAAQISPDKPLTDKQKAFVKAWASGDSISAATLRAGFAEDGIGYRLVRMPNILALKAKYEAKYEEEAQMTRKKVMDGFLEAIDMAKLMAEPATMVSGWREIAKMCGYMAPVEHKMKVDVTGNIVLDRMNSMSDAELLKVITAGAQEALTHDPDSI